LEATHGRVTEPLRIVGSLLLTTIAGVVAIAPLIACLSDAARSPAAGIERTLIAATVAFGLAQSMAAFRMLVLRSEHPLRWAAAETTLSGAAAAALAVPDVRLAAGAVVAGATVLTRVVQDPLARALFTRRDAARRDHPLVTALAVGLAMLSVVQASRAALFAARPGLRAAADLPLGEPVGQHSCVTAYALATLLARDGVPNLYHPRHYSGFDAAARATGLDLFPFSPEPFLYPPPFLLLPRGLLLAGGFPEVRALWFTLQALSLLAVLATAVGWLEASGPRMALFFSLFWLSLPVQQTLTMGNYHLLAIALALAGRIALERGHRAGGAALLGFAVVSKLFPGILVIELLARRRYRDVAGVAIAMTGLTVAAGALFGWGPLRAFIGYELPRLLGGEAFPTGTRTLLTNLSLPGLVEKLPALRGSTLGMAVSRAVTILGGALVALVAGRVAEPPCAEGERMPRERAEPGSTRRTSLVRWLGLLNLGAATAGFLPLPYGLVGTLWLLAVVATAGGKAERATAGAALLTLGLLPLAPTFSLPLALASSALLTLSTLGINLWAGLGARLSFRRA
jgi:hypothetical protein